MKPSILLVSSVLAACASAPEPEPSQPEREQFEASIEASIDAAVAVAPPVLIDAAQPDATPPLLRVPGVIGFYCIESWQNSEQPATRCFRGSETCEYARKELLKLKHHVGECAYRDRAVCFGMTDTKAQSTHWRCGDTAELCKADLRHFQEIYPDFKFGDCEPSASLLRSPTPTTGLWPAH
jgi:hypothetical protein